MYGNIIYHLMENNCCLCLLLSPYLLLSPGTWRGEEGRKEKPKHYYSFSTNNNTSRTAPLYLLRFCQNTNNIFCIGSYKELTPEEICLRNPQTQTKSLKVLRKQQFNTFPASVPCITHNLMSHPAEQTHPEQINPSWLQLSGTSEEQHDTITRTREAGQKANEVV